jgi:hypothetical protein
LLLLFAGLIAAAAASAPLLAQAPATPDAAPTGPAPMPEASVALPTTALTSAVPKPASLKLGQCVNTEVASLGQRLKDARTGNPIRGSGSVIRFRNKIEQVSYDEFAAINHSHIGDPVRICLEQLPTDCPAGDDRGKVYKTTNLRTKRSWTLPDSEHSCGGA